MKPLLENNRQAFKVRLLLWGSLLACAAALYWGWDLFNTFGLNPGDGGVLRPVGERLAVGAFVAALGLAFAGGMMAYACHYAVYMARDGKRLVIDTLTPWGLGTRRHHFDAGQIGESNYHSGRLIARVSVNAPWLTLPVAGRRFPFILDAQAETLRQREIETLSRDATKRGQSRS